MSWWSRLFGHAPSKPTQKARVLYVSVTPPDARVVLTPQGGANVGPPSQVPIVADGYGHQALLLPANLPAWGADLDVSAPGYVTMKLWVGIPLIDFELAGGVALVKAQHRPELIPRAPLPPMPPGSYDRTLPFTQPSGPDGLFYRGNFCGIRVPGLPLLEGMSGYTVAGWKDNAVGGLNPPIMALDVPRYTKVSWELVDQYLHDYAARGYTHLQCSVGHAIEAGLSIDDYLAYTDHVEALGLFRDHWFLGGGPWRGRNEDGSFTEHRDQDRNHWAPLVDPWIDALLANKAIDAACVGWQLDQFNTGDTQRGTRPSPIQTIIDYFADRLGPSNIPIGTHWVNEAGGWWDPQDPRPGASVDRFSWWRNQRNKLLWFHHQGDVSMPVGMYQAKLCDTLNPFGDGRMGRSGLFDDRPFGLVIYECSASEQYDLRMSEDEGDLRGYLLCCTKAASAVAGYGNGGRLPDGSVL